MTPERWREIEELYHSARERGFAALSGTDPEIRREVERLLAYDREERILDGNAAELMGEFTGGESAVPSSDLSGQTLFQYRILEKLGAGGMGVVYKAFDTKLGRPAALKFLPAHLSNDEEWKTRLSEEARAASALDHPNIVVIYDIEEGPSGELFIAMAFHEGMTLRQRIAEGVSLRDALDIARQVAAGLAKAHENGIVHRDIKPANIVVDQNRIARIIDFGLAKSNETLSGAARGTPMYMSPEQASGKTVDFRTDLWSLGAVLYEMLSGKPAFRGESQLELMRAVMEEDPPALRDVPAPVAAIVSRALQKDPARRFASAREFAEQLSSALAQLDGRPRERFALRPRYAIPAAAAVILLAALAAGLYYRSEKRHWAREQAIPEITRLRSQSKPLAAFRLMQEAQKYLDGDPQLSRIAETITHPVSIRSSPPGATVEIKDYLSPDDAWFQLGVTPLENVRIPAGYLRWRVAKAGVGEYTGAPITEDIHGFVHDFDFALDRGSSAPAGMVAIPAVKYADYIWSLGDLGPYDLPAFYLDRFEVTNRDYQQFVDRGGYTRREFWTEKFIRDGKELSWEQAMELFHDATGHPGPANWKAGHYPAGEDDHPVGGVSWYEASAYAAFAGKSLPTIAQWYLAAPSLVARYILPVSNFGTAPAPVGKFQGIGPWGTYDMAGNVAEWCVNEAGGGARYLLGGAWNAQTSEYFEPAGIPPFHRGPNAGIRCVRNTAPLPAEALAERRQTIRDFAHAKPAPDSVFQIYKAMYAYDRTPLRAKQENIVQESPNWRREKITFDAAYGGERIPAYLFVPSRGKPPYQVVVFFPSARVLDLQSSDKLGDMKFVDYIIESGRAVMYPVYKGTYERSAPPPGPDTAAARETLIQDSKDIGRSLDYLETRPDIDRNRIAYLGVSMGAALGVNWVGVENRFKAAIMLDGGFFAEKPLPGADAVDFAPHIKAPTLLVTGKFDWIFLGKSDLLRLLGTPASQKKGVTLATAHDVSEQRSQLVAEVLAWLDRYLGRVE